MSGGGGAAPSRPKGAPKGVPKGDEAPPQQERSVLDTAFKGTNCADVDFSKTSGGGSGGHLGYNSNGLYVKAAACYTLKMYQKAKGTA
jgi:hypothetical protein